MRPAPGTQNARACYPPPEPSARLTEGTQDPVSVRREERRRKDGTKRTMYLVDIKHQQPSGEVIRLRRVSPVPTLRGARAYELELREALRLGRPLPAAGAEDAEGAAELAASPRTTGSMVAHHQEVKVEEQTITAPPSARGGHKDAPAAGGEPAKPARKRARRPKQAPWQDPQGEPVRVPTLAEFVPEFMRFQASPSASRRGANKPNELREKQRIFDNHLIPTFGAVPLDRFTARMIDNYVASKTAPAGVPRRSSRRLGKPLAPATVANHLILLRRVLSVAQRWEIIHRIPVVTCPASDNRRLDFLPFEEAERLLAAAGEWRTLFLLMMRTGLRLGELRGLRWQDVDLARGLLRVHQSLTKAGFGTPKSGKARTVELASDALMALREESERAAATPEALVFLRADGRPLSEQQVYRLLQAAARDAGITRHVHPHLLRHTFASHCVMRGIPLTAVKEWLGHSELRMTERYAHLAPEVRSDLIERLSTGSRGNATENLLTSRGNPGATALPQNRGTTSSPG